MSTGGSVKSRRELVRALLMTVGTSQETLRRKVTEKEIIHKLHINNEFEKELVRTVLRNVAEDARSPLAREQTDEGWLYDMTRLDTVDDYIAGLKEDGVDPAEL